MCTITIISIPLEVSADTSILRLQDPRILQDPERSKNFKCIFTDMAGNFQCSGNAQEFSENNCSFIACKKFVKLTIEETNRMLGLDMNCEIQIQLHNNNTGDTCPLLPPQSTRLPIDEIYYSDDYYHILPNIN